MIILIFVVVRSQATDVTTDVGVNNSAPTIDSINMGTATSSSNLNDAALTLSSNTTVPVHISGTLSDVNGCSEIDATTQLIATFYLSGASCDPDSPTEDQVNCYKATASQCTISNCDSAADTSETYDCLLDIQHFATAGSWYASVDITDDYTLSDEQITTPVATTQSLTAMGLSVSAINWTSIGIGATSSDEIVNIMNYGNDNDLDVNLAATTMPCNIRGTIPVANLAYATGTVAYASKTTMSSTAIGFELNQTKGTQASPIPGTDVKFQVQLPTTGVAGSCSGTIAIATQ